MLESDLKNYEAFLQGDISAFERLVIKYRDPMVSFIYRYTNDIHLAQDLAQEAFVDVLIHKERFRTSENFKTYLYTIGRNKAIDYIRKNQKYIFMHTPAEHLEPIKGLDEVILDNEEKRELYQKLMELKPEYQVAILLIDFESLSYQEAAKVMGKSLSQMKVLVHRARKSLAKLMRKEGM